MLLAMLLVSRYAELRVTLLLVSRYTSTLLRQSFYFNIFNGSSTTTTF